MQNLRLPRFDLTTTRGKTILVVATSAAVLVAILAVLLALGVVFGPQRSGYPYQATIPGSLCDRTPSVWKDWVNSTSACSANSMLLLVSPSGGAFAQEAFYGPSGAPIPANYRFSVKISDIRSHGCAGTQYQLSKDATARHYGVAICTDGSWNVGVHNAAGQPIGQPLAQGHYEQAGTTTLTVTYTRGE
jgi:hypothetical protein